jgi:molybdopterin molybdotransferase
MLEYEEAVTKATQLGQELGLGSVERVRVEFAFGRILGEDVRAVWPVPARDYSAMDGYAVSTRDFQTETWPLSLPVRGESRPGAEPTLLQPGEVRRIFTGGSVPEGADAIVIQENVVQVGAEVEFRESPRPGDHIRRAGEDLRPGTLAISAGTRISASAQSLLAMLERTEVLVRGRPRVGILCTGDELRDPVGVEEATSSSYDAESALPKGLAESNSLALRTMAELRGALVRVLPRVKDNPELLRSRLIKAIEDCDVVVTVGGASVGDHDLVKPVLADLGAELWIPKVAIKPGKPVFLARRGPKAILGLPGNPTSALVTFCLFGWPLLGAWLGDKEPRLPEVLAPLAGSYRQKPGRRSFLRGHWSADGVRVLPNQASGAGTAIASANVLIHLDANVEALEPGSAVRVIPLWGL